MEKMPLLLKISILLFAYVILAFLVSFIVRKFFKRIAQKTKTTFDDYLIKVSRLPLVITIILIGCLHILYLWEIPKLYKFCINSGIKTFLVFIWWITSLRIIRELAKRKFPIFSKKGHLEADVVLLLKNLSYALITIIAIIIGLKIWKIDLSPFLASAGIAGIALALAAKETLANFFGGISIFLDRTYKVGDYIILDSGERGEVIDVGIRSTRIKTRDDVVIIIPNSIMANSKIINESAPEPRFRLRIPVGVAYSSDLELVEKVLLTLVKEIKHIVSSPEPRVRYREFGDSSINLELLCWVDDPRNKGIVTHELIKKIHKEFNKKGITIPFPQRDVHLYSE